MYSVDVLTFLSPSTLIQNSKFSSPILPFKNFLNISKPAFDFNNHTFLSAAVGWLLVERFLLPVEDLRALTSEYRDGLLCPLLVDAGLLVWHVSKNKLAEFVSIFNSLYSEYRSLVMNRGNLWVHTHSWHSNGLQSWREKRGDSN